MQKKRVALVTESTARKNEPTPAHVFYSGPYNKWVNSIIKFLEESDFPKEDAYFLSYLGYKIYRYDELVSWYDKAPDPSSVEREEFARIIIDFLKTHYNCDEIIVDLHLSKLKYDKLIKLLGENNIEYSIFADGVPLGEKPNFYESLIMENNQYRRLRDMKQEKYNMIRMIPNKTPEEAKQFYDQFKHLARRHEVEDIFQELKQSLKAHWQAKKATEKAREEAIKFIENEKDNESLLEFIQDKELLSNLFHDIQVFESLNHMHGKVMAKIERYLVKSEYQIQKEHLIRSSLLRLQIVLMKG